MSRSIKVSQEVYDELVSHLRPRETFSQEIADLLNTAALMEKALPLLHQERPDLQERFAAGGAAKAAQ